MTRETALPDRLAQAIKASRMKQVEIAARARLSPSYLSKVLRGTKTPSRRVVDDLAGVLGVTAEWLAGGRGAMPAHRARVGPNAAVEVPGTNSPPPAAEVADQLQGAMASLSGAGADFGPAILDHLSRQVQLLTTLAAAIAELKKEVSDLRERGQPPAAQGRRGPSTKRPSDQRRAAG